MTAIAVPYHLDEYLPDLDLPLEPDEVVTVQFPPGDWPCSMTPWQARWRLTPDSAVAPS
jgi:hypothetical protein